MVYFSEAPGITATRGALMQGGAQPDGDKGVNKLWGKHAGEGRYWTRRG